VEDLSLLGNAAAVPIIVAITQFLKKNFNFRRKADAISLLVSFGVCIGWEFYYTPTDKLFLLWSGGIIETGKHIIHLGLVSVATWMSASKSYDLLLGDKKRHREIGDHIEEKENLKKQVEKLKNGHGEKSELSDETLEVDNKVRDILEGR
jgi:hypothetical protein